MGKMRVYVEKRLQKKLQLTNYIVMMNELLINRVLNYF